MPSTPTGRLLAIGDIHGCSAALGRLLGEVAPTSNDALVFLGDYVDRGLDSAGVIDRVIRLRKSCYVIALRGNHEEMMMNARQSKEHLQLWLNCGGDMALMSYAPESDQPSLRDVPQTLWDFLERDCVDFYETETHIFVHGGLVPELLPRNQSTDILRWQKFPPPAPHKSGKIVVCGHTPQKTGRPANVGHAICIDANACRDGYLTCLDVNTAQILQCNERGDLRTDALPAPKRRW
jgi:serine/threonine protein phosphatase 1